MDSEMGIEIQLDAGEVSVLNIFAGTMETYDRELSNRRNPDLDYDAFIESWAKAEEAVAQEDELDIENRKAYLAGINSLEDVVDTYRETGRTPVRDVKKKTDGRTNIDSMSKTYDASEYFEMLDNHGF